MTRNTSIYYVNSTHLKYKASIIFFPPTSTVEKKSSSILWQSLGGISFLISLILIGESLVSKRDKNTIKAKCANKAYGLNEVISGYNLYVQFSIRKSK